MASRLDIDRAAIRGLDDHEAVKDALEKVGRQVAAEATLRAPKRTGRGSESIHHELGEDEHGAWVRVSWSKQAFYMRFHELGTSEMRARPFLRPALDRRYTL